MPRSHRPRSHGWAFALLLLLAVCAGCSKDDASGGDEGAGATAAAGADATAADGATQGASDAAPAGGELRPFAVEPLSAAELRLDAELAEEAGLTAALGPDIVAWLAEERGLALRDALEGSGLLVARLGGPMYALDVSRRRLPIRATRQSAESPITTGAALSLALRGAMSYGYQRPTSGYLDTTREESRTVGSHEIATSTHVTGTVARTGSQISGDLTVTQTTTVTTASGNVVSRSTTSSTWHAELNACPDAGGIVTIQLRGDASASAGGSGGASRRQLSGSSRVTVGDDARISSVNHTFAGGGGGSADPTLEYAATLLVQLAADAAQDRWRDGACVRIESSVGSTYEAEPDEVVRFTAQPMHVVEGTQLDKPVVATFSGRVSATPLNTPQRPPAQLTYTAPTPEGPAGVVTLKSTSNRGIGTLDLRFRVGGPLAFELEIRSTIDTNKLSYLHGPAALSTAVGRIRLFREDGASTWSGLGTMEAQSVPGPGGCATTTLIASGSQVTLTGPNVSESYDWIIAAAVLPTVTAAMPTDRNGDSIALYIDAGPVEERGNPLTSVHCPSTGPIILRGFIRHWESFLFLGHSFEQSGYGIPVRDWDVVATDQTWRDGGLVATREWPEDCGGRCTGKTVFQLFVIPR